MLFLFLHRPVIYFHGGYGYVEGRDAVMRFAYKKGLLRLVIFLVVFSGCLFFRECIVYWPVLMTIIVGGGAYCVLDGFF